MQDGVVEHLAAAGLDPRYGARPLHREIERAVVRPLARLLIAQQPRAGDLIVLHATGGDIALDVHRVREAPRVAPPAAPPTEPSRHVAELRDAAHELSDSASAVTAREALSALVDASNEPGFWDRPDEARAVLARLYELQRIFDDLRALRDRVDGLVGLSAHAARDRTRVGEVRQASGEIEHRLAVLRLELAGAGSGQQEVQLTCAAVGSAGEEWAASLLAMYAAWADRTGREVIQGEGALVLNGLGVGALLAHEAGLHRHELAEGSQATARVTVAIDGTPAPAADSDAAGEVVRVYEEGRRTGVRDPRTGVVVGNVRAVLHEGRIDEFILAGLDLGAG